MNPILSKKIKQNSMVVKDHILYLYNKYTQQSRLSKIRFNKILLCIE